MIGVCGAGTMGRGIAQAAALGGLGVRLHDPVPGALDGAGERIAADLDRGAGRGRWSVDDARAASARVTAAARLDELGGCELVIEAAPEDLELKQRLFAQLADVVAPDCVLATNTSSLLVTAVAAATPHPERVVGLHFFNPAPLMRLVELVAGEASGEAALARAEAVGAAMGKRVIRAADVAGFVVNRCNRPFGLESLRLLQEQLTTVEQADRICRRAGFRMGPFELMDLVGTDVGLDVSRSFYAQSFGEPRWRPSPSPCAWSPPGGPGASRAGAGTTTATGRTGPTTRRPRTRAAATGAWSWSPAGACSPRSCGRPPLRPASTFASPPRPRAIHRG
ncbi:MAG: 3-hydroxyacyl-CoA dehydrogenase NAD-binding domain-containing protein [Solirubrobacteraceae bacterium]